MLVMGIYEGHNASCSLIEGNKILYSVEEERLSRIKGHDGRNKNHGLPIKSIRWVSKKLKDKKVDKIAIALETPENLRSTSMILWLEAIKKQNCIEILDFFTVIDKKTLEKYNISKTEYYDISYITQKRRIIEILELIKNEGHDISKVEFIEHHRAHNASCFYNTNDDEGIIFSLDGRGDALSGSVYTFEGKNLNIKKKISSLNSIGHFYSAITVALGFKAVKHEGKITGLAAFGNVKKELLKKFKKFVSISENGLSIETTLFMGGMYGPYPYANFKRYIDKIRKTIKNFSKKDVAATAQYITENIVCEWVTNWTKKVKKKNVHLCGGVFSNVKLNQKISEINFIKTLTVHPGMTDCGLSVGAALDVSKPNIRKMPKDYYLGPEVDYNEIEELILKNKNKFLISCPKNISKVAANSLSNKKIVARFDGRLEYGPRALGNRSILYHAGDKSVNDWLNKQLQRTEFMPFAPVTLLEDLEKYYLLPKKINILNSLKYMTITVNCSELMKKQCPAVVHVDGTARPQLIDKKTNKKYYSILKEYKKITGISTLVNTSFNLHDEPIVNTPAEALKAFNDSKIHCLILGKYFIERLIK